MNALIIEENGPVVEVYIPYATHEWDRVEQQWIRPDDSTPAPTHNSHSAGRLASSDRIVSTNPDLLLNNLLLVGYISLPFQQYTEWSCRLPDETNCLWWRRFKKNPYIVMIIRHYCYMICSHIYVRWSEWIQSKLNFSCKGVKYNNQYTSRV
jgi:hypothetical protein